MKYLGPTTQSRLNEAVALVLLFAGLFVFLGLVSYNPFDPSWNTATGATRVVNLTGRIGAFMSDFLLQALGLGAYAVPVLMLLLSWRWIWSAPIEAPWVKTIGATMLLTSTCAAFGLGPGWRPIASAIPAGGLVGSVMADFLMSSMNLAGAALFTAAVWVVSIYLVSKFEMSRLPVWFRGPIGWGKKLGARWSAWLSQRAIMAKQRAE